MSNINFPQLPQFSGMFTRLGSHHDYGWEPLPWKGVFNKVLLFDRCTGLTLELAKVEKGAKFPEHYHTTVQTQFLVSGRLRLKGGDILDPGAFNIIPAGQLHGPFEAVEEAISNISLPYPFTFCQMGQRSYTAKMERRLTRAAFPLLVRSKVRTLSHSVF